MCLCFFIVVVHSIMSSPNEVDYAINSHHNGWPRTGVAAKGADYQSSLRPRQSRLNMKASQLSQSGPLLLPLRKLVITAETLQWGAGSGIVSSHKAERLEDDL